MATPSAHAVAKHGSTAQAVARRMAKAENTWSGVGKDGRQYTFAERPCGKKWDVSIDVDGYNVTKFVCSSRNWIARKLLWCSLIALIVGCSVLYLMQNCMT